MNQLSIGFMANGASDCNNANLSAALKHYDGGHIDFMDGLLSHVTYCDALIEAGSEVYPHIAGVDFYEVHEPFGHWYVEETLRCEAGGNLPEPETCQAQLRELVKTFFLRAADEENAGAKEHLLDAAMDKVTP